MTEPYFEMDYMTHKTLMKVVYKYISKKSYKSVGRRYLYLLVLKAVDWWLVVLLSTILSIIVMHMAKSCAAGKAISQMKVQ
jgi:hypothetical protein